MLEHVHPPRLLVYLDCSVDTAMARIQKRNRGLESGIPRDYLQRLNERYLQWYSSYDLSPKVFVDTESESLDAERNAYSLLQQIRPFLEGGN